MSRRLRRASTSSVESIDESQIRRRPESSVLERVNWLEEEAPWPIFELHNVIILNKNGKALENAFDVATRGPYIVRGDLYIGPKDTDLKARLINRIRGPVPIESTNCTRYSFGLGLEGESAPPVIWVSGDAGWYEIKSPCRAFYPIFHEMRSTVHLNYRLQIAYEEMFEQMGNEKKQILKRLRQPRELREVLTRCAAKMGNGATVEDVVKLVSKNQAFLLAELGDFKKTALYETLSSPKQIDIAAQMLRIFAAYDTSPDYPALPLPQKPPSPQKPATLQRKSNVSDSARNAKSVSSEPSQRSSRLRSGSRETSHPLRKSDITVPVMAPPSRPSPSSSHKPGVPSEGLSALDSLISALEFAYDELINGRTGLSVSATLNKLYINFRFPTFKDNTPGCHKIPIEEVLAYNAKDLLDSLDWTRWAQTEFWQYLQAKKTEKFAPRAMKLSDFPFRVMPRGSRPRASKTTAPSAASNQPRRGQVATRNGTDDEDDEDDDMDQFITPMRGKAPKGPRPSQSGLRLARKRLHSSLDSDSEDSDGGDLSKRLRAWDNNDDEVDESLATPSHPARNEEEDGPDDRPLRIVLQADRIPSRTPKGPDNTWTCEEEGCDRIVRGGDEEDCQRRIQEHITYHEEEAVRVTLAKTESRGLLPIDHLLDKLKRAGKRQTQQIEIDGIPLPPAIQRHLLA